MDELIKKMLILKKTLISLNFIIAYIKWRINNLKISTVYPLIVSFTLYNGLFASKFYCRNECES
jgi:hypothetical protein